MTKYSLSPRQSEVLRLLSAGFSNAEISTMLDLPQRTVERHVSDLYAKLGVHGRDNARARITARYHSGSIV